MTTRAHISRWLSPSLFALVALCFVLPFATASCDNASTSFTGIQLVTRTVPSGGVVDEPGDCTADISSCVERAASTTATVALLAALIGLALGVIGIVRGPGWAATLGAGAMLVLPFEGGFADVGLHDGYILALLLFLLVWGVHVRRAWCRSHPDLVPRSAPAVHARALLLYVCLDVLLVVLGTAGGAAGTVGRLGAGWLTLVGLPAWLVVALLTARWSRRETPALSERVGRIDGFLWLGPLLLVALASKRVRVFLAPPMVRAAERRPAHVWSSRA